MNTRRPFDTHGQGQDCEECMRASRLALGMDPDADPMENRWVRILALILAVCAVGMVLERLGFPLVWPL